MQPGAILPARTPCPTPRPSCLEKPLVWLNSACAGTASGLPPRVHLGRHKCFHWPSACSPDTDVLYSSFVSALGGCKVHALAKQVSSIAPVFWSLWQLLPLLEHISANKEKPSHLPTCCCCSAATEIGKEMV